MIYTQFRTSFSRNSDNSVANSHDVAVREVLRADLAKRSTHPQLPPACLLVPDGVDGCRVALDTLEY